jgi:hypothetical protein
MKNLSIWLFLLFGITVSHLTQAQEIVPYSFNYRSDGSHQGELKKLTNINYGATTTLRLYFQNVKLEGESYILLKNHDGRSQKLDSLAMADWDNSSAYFNGNNLEVHLFEREGHRSSFEISSIRISNPLKNGDNQNSARTNSHVVSGQNNSTIDFPELEGPYKEACGRFTNGNDVFGTGWIAPNGAIVTSRDVWANYVYGQLYDVIEFNIPPANDDGSINHPGPEDQYPLKVDPLKVSKYSSPVVIESIKDKNINHQSDPGYAILKPLPNSLGQLPGERQQASFRIAVNPNVPYIKENTSRGMDVSNIVVSIIHHGINFHPTYSNRTTQFEQSRLRNPEKYIEGSYFEDNILNVSDRQKFLVYAISSIPSQKYSGGPILWGVDLAIGVHNENFEDGTSVGFGFRPDYFRETLEVFMTGQDTYYLDGTIKDGSGQNLINGKIHRPFRSLKNASEDIPSNSILNISKGHYGGSVTIDKPMKLIAPVGKVVLGASDPSARMATGVPFEEYEIAELEEEDPKLELPAKEPKAYPNPFVDNLTVNFYTTENARVNVQIYDMRGNLVNTLLESKEFLPGSHEVSWNGQISGSSAPRGLYVVLLKVNHSLSSIKIIKN